MTKNHLNEFSKECAELKKIAGSCLALTLLSDSRISKHKPWTWKDESEDGHLNKALRHILTYQIIRDGEQTDDNEDHLANALTRLTMAITKLTEFS